MHTNARIRKMRRFALHGLRRLRRPIRYPRRGCVLLYYFKIIHISKLGTYRTEYEVMIKDDKRGYSTSQNQ